MADLVIRNALEGRICPARSYLASLAPSGRRGMETALKTILDHAQPGVTLDEFPWGRLRYEHTAAIRAWLIEKYAARSAAKMIAALRGVLKVCWRQGLIDDASYRHAIDVKGPPIFGHVRPGREIKGDEISALFKAAQAGPHGAHDLAIFTVLYAAGLRRHEIVAIDVKHYQPAEGCLTVLGKRGRIRTVYLPTFMRGRFEAWWKTRTGAETPVFHRFGVRGPGGRLHPDEINTIVQRVRKAAGVAPFTPHDFRRTYATILIDKGVDLVTVRNLMGHANIATTALYDRRDDTAKQGAPEKLPPVKWVREGD